MLCHVMLRYVMLRYGMVSYVTLCDVMVCVLWYVCYVMGCDGMLYEMYDMMLHM